MRCSKNIVSAGPSASAASIQALSALPMQPRKTNRLSAVRWADNRFVRPEESVRTSANVRQSIALGVHRDSGEDTARAPPVTPPGIHRTVNRDYLVAAVTRFPRSSPRAANSIGPNHASWRALVLSTEQSNFGSIDFGVVRPTRRKTADRLTRGEVGLSNSRLPPPKGVQRRRQLFGSTNGSLAKSEPRAGRNLLTMFRRPANPRSARSPGGVAPILNRRKRPVFRIVDWARRPWDWGLSPSRAGWDDGFSRSARWHWEQVE